MKEYRRKSRLFFAVAATLLVFLSVDAKATIDGITGPNFNLTLRSGELSTADGNSIYFWGLADTGSSPSSLAQYPAPTLIVNQGDPVVVTLTNELDVASSLVFPGQENVVATGTQGLITKEAAPINGVATYSFTASNPGTYMYYSGTRPELQIEMGIVGALIVRPATGNQAYGHPDTAYDHEYLFLLSEIDSIIHETIQFGLPVDNTTFQPKYWMINGRALPDTLFPKVPWLPHQPYGSIAQMHPGDKLLLRVVSAGRDLHPLHTHGNNSEVIARDGKMLESVPGAGPDLRTSIFTIDAVPGETVDAIFQWTGKGLGWDMYGHDGSTPCTDNDGDGFEDTTHEWCADHGKPVPVDLPGGLDVGLGGFYSGSPFLGQSQALPNGEGGLNENNSYFYMWHSHTEKELINYGIFPGGMLTMLLIEHPDVPIP